MLARATAESSGGQGSYMPGVRPSQGKGSRRPGSQPPSEHALWSHGLAKFERGGKTEHYISRKLGGDLST